MKVLSTLVLAAAINAIGIGSASATVVFSDDFNSYGEAIPAAASFGGWNVISGSVDIIGAGTAYDWFSGVQGKYLDLDGSTNSGGQIATSIIFGPGSYVINFDLAGSQRGDSNDVVVSFGGNTWNYTVASGDGFLAKSFTFTTLTATTLAFQNGGGDNIGALLDNVSVTAVPEPSTYGMMFGGLIMVAGLVARKSRQSRVR
ncbi:MAG: PEP-CTERM sorting domain-containing protein [Methylophilus sp.]|uniref:PEP-CTERM sorting domain-containing protein n=1 Tax=Methylophilus sp. TaxID=29541 RepID=UPI003F9F58FC